MSDSIAWRRLCRIPLDGSVPHPTTLMKLTTRCGSAGGATRTKMRDRSRSAGERAHDIGSKLRLRTAARKNEAQTDEAQTAVRRVTGELADLAEKAARDAERLLANAKRTLRRARARAAQQKERGQRDAAAGRRRGQLTRAVNDLTKLLDATLASPRRPANASPVSPLTARRDGSACTTRTAARSPRAGSANRSSSATPRTKLNQDPP